MASYEHYRRKPALSGIGHAGGPVPCYYRIDQNGKALEHRTMAFRSSFRRFHGWIWRHVEYRKGSAYRRRRSRGTQIITGHKILVAGTSFSHTATGTGNRPLEGLIMQAGPRPPGGELEKTPPHSPHPHISSS